MLPAFAITTDGPSETGILYRVSNYAKRINRSKDFHILTVRQGHVYNEALKKAFIAKVRNLTAHEEPVLLFPPEQVNYDYFFRTTFEELAVCFRGPVFNKLENCGKYLRRHDNLRQLKAAGFRVPTVYDVQPSADKLKTTFPAVIRSVDGHGGLGRLKVVNNQEELLAYGKQRVLMMAVEYVDTRHPDGTFWKYRTVVVGDRAIPRQLQISKSWEVRLGSSVKNEIERAEALKFLAAPDPFEKELVAAAKSVGLDFACIDYSILPDGGMVIWEIFLPFAVTKQYPEYEDRLFDAILKFVTGEQGA